MKSSLHGLIPFLPFLLNHLGLPSPVLDKTHSNDLLCPFITPRHRPCRKQHLYCWQGLFTNSLPRSERPIVVRVRFLGNAFTESLPSCESICHNISEYVDHRGWRSYKYVCKFRMKCHVRHVTNIGRCLKSMTETNCEAGSMVAAQLPCSFHGL
jgi:hypothetical protein